MIGYVTLGTNDLDRGTAFYESVLSAAGAKKLSTTARGVVFGFRPDEPKLMIITPLDEQDATVGNGTMIALEFDSRDVVDRIHSRALELGAADEGTPGPRATTDGYFAYFRDMDGHKLAVFTLNT
jgi:catechol 2,3-dioxygenase-like lactoylglutathione lyase family enzyme